MTSWKSRKGLEKADRLAHRRLQVQRLDILPVLLEKRDEEVDTKHDVSKYLVIGHLNVADGNTQAKDLLELELDGGTDLSDLVAQVFRVGDRSGELSSLRQTRTKETRNLLDQSFRGKESIVLLRKLLDKLFVLVQLFQIIHGHVLEIDLFSTIYIGGVSENADGHARAGDIGQFHGSGETLVSLRVVVLETNLELNRLDEVSFLLAGCFSE